MRKHYSQSSAVAKVKCLKQVQAGQVIFSFWMISLIILLPIKLFAQAPTLSYTSPQVYTAGTAITTLTPTSSGVAAIGYSNTHLTLGSGFSSPYGVAVDATGKIYVADFGHHQVKAIPAGGGTPVVLGSGYEGPYGVAVDAAGNVYVADGGNGLKMIPAGGAQVGIGSGFISSHGVAVDPAGNIYVADNGAIVKLPPGGGSQVTISTVSVAFGLAADAAGNVYVANGSSVIQKIAATGGGAPVSIGSGFSNAEGVAVDAAGNIYVADYGHGAIKEIPAGGGTPVSLGTGFNKPYGVAVDGAGNLYVGDTGNNAVKEMTPVGGYFISPALPAGLSFDNASGTISGTPTMVSPAINYTVTAYNSSGAKPATVNIKVNASSSAISISYSSPQTYTAGTAITPLVPTVTGTVAATGYGDNMLSLGSGFSSPYGVAVDAAGNVFVGDLNNGQVKKIPVGGGLPVVLGNFAQPNGVAVDPAGNVYIADGATGVAKIPAGGGAPVSIGSGITNPNGIAVDAAGNVFVSDLGDGTVKEIQVNGGATINLSLTGDFLSPYGVAVDPAGNIYVADLEGNAVKKIPAGGGSAVPIGGAFNVPFGVATDAAGNVYVADSGNKLVKEIPVGGATVTIGKGFLNPYGIAVDGAGNVFVSDQINNTVKQIRPNGGFFITPLLPAGLKFSNSTGIISGKPTEANAAQNYTVTAYNSTGSTQATVNIKVNASNNAYLSNLTISAGTLSPAFAMTTAGYTTIVSNATSSLTISPTLNNPNGSVKVNGVAVSSGTASAAIPLVVGNTTITIVVTAQDGVTHKTYTVIVNRISNNPYLSALVLSSGTLNPVFAPATGSYTASVSNATTSITATPTLNNPYASVKVNGTTVTSGAASAAIPLIIGTNTITTVVTAQDGITHKTYTVVVTRPSNNTYLSSLTISSGTLSPAFAMATGSYTDAVGNGVNTVIVTPTLNNPNGSVKVNGTVVNSGTASAAIPLNVGDNTISTVVTAQDGVTHKTYTITVTRAISGMNSLYIPGADGQSPLTFSLNQKVEANNILSPNGDGVNDIWVVKNIAFYPDNTVTVYDRAGQVVFTKKGYNNDWGGAYRSATLSEGTYYYNVDLGNGTHLKGFITVVSH